MAQDFLSPTVATTLASNVGAWVSANHAALAKRVAADFYGQGRLSKPVVYTDGRKGKDPDLVKPFGQIIYAPGLGPMKEAIELAMQIVSGQVGHQVTGFYAKSFQWYVNGDPIAGVPDGSTLGPRSNVQLANLAPYATMREIQVPRGVLYAAFNALTRTFGRRLVLQYGYRKPVGAFSPDTSGPYGDRPIMNVPVLTISSPSGKMRRKLTRPGAARRQRKRRARGV